MKKWGYTFIVIFSVFGSSFIFAQPPKNSPPSLFGKRYDDVKNKFTPQNGDKSLKTYECKNFISTVESDFDIPTGATHVNLGRRSTVPSFDEEEIKVFSPNYVDFKLKQLLKSKHLPKGEVLKVKLCDSGKISIESNLYIESINSSLDSESTFKIIRYFLGSLDEEKLK